MGKRDSVSWCVHITIHVVLSVLYLCIEGHSIVLQNAIFGNVGRVVSEEVVLQLINTKCMPSLLYGLEACPLAKSELSSLDFVVNRFFMMMFRTSNIEIVRNCQSYFGFKLPSELWSIRVEKFDVKYASCGGSFVNYGTNVT